MAKIIINIGNQIEGRTFQLDSKSSNLIKDKYKVNPFNKLYVSYDTQFDFEKTYCSIWGQIAQILTNLKDSELKELKVLFKDPVNGKTLKEI